MDEEKDNKRKPTAADAAIDYVAYLMETEGMDNSRQQQSTTIDIIDSFISSSENGKIELKAEPEFTPEIEEEEETEGSEIDESSEGSTLDSDSN